MGIMLLQDIPLALVQEGKMFLLHQLMITVRLIGKKAMAHCMMKPQEAL
jgi:hypothetical protein